MELVDEASSDLRNEKYAGVAYPIPPKPAELKKNDNLDLKENIEKKRMFGRNITMNFFSRKNKK